MARGRPVEYNDELAKAAWDYADEGWKQANDTIPSVVGLCRAINRSKSTIYLWAQDEDKEISDILEFIMEKQQLELVSNGLTGDFNSTITKLMLTKHGFHDKVDSAHNLTSMPHEDWLDLLDE